MALLSDLLNTLPDGEISEVIIGLHWTAVVTYVDGEKRCGLATTSEISHEHHSQPDVPDAGKLETSTGLELARFACSDNSIMRSVGVAAINALLHPPIQDVVNTNAEEVIASLGLEKCVVLVADTKQQATLY